MKILFVSSGRQGDVNPIIRNQGESLRKAGVELEYFVVAGRGWKSYMKSIKPLREKVLKGGYDVVHAHYSWCAYLTGIAMRGMKVPMVVSLMGNDILDHWWYPVLARMVAKCKPWKAVIVKSQEMKNRVGMPYANVIPNGVNMERFHPMDKEECQKRLGWNPVSGEELVVSGKKHVLFPARKEDGRKNWPLAFEAVQLLNGEGFSGLVVSGKIELHEMRGVKNEETPIWYNAADAAVLPSFYEGSANALKEAMACNCPIVTTDMGDCRERIEGCEGCSVVGNNDWKLEIEDWRLKNERWEWYVREFAAALKKAIEHGKTEGRERLLKDGMADYQIAERLIKIYEQCKV